jgi:hypothetical protein
MENGGTEGAPRGDGPSLKILYLRFLFDPKFSSVFRPIIVHVRGSGGFAPDKGISLRPIGGSPRAGRARCQLANPTTQRRQGGAVAVRWGGGLTAAGRVTGVSLDRFSERHLSRF